MPRPMRRSTTPARSLRTTRRAGATSSSEAQPPSLLPRRTRTTRGRTASPPTTRSPRSSSPGLLEPRSTSSSRPRASTSSTRRRPSTTPRRRPSRSSRRTTTKLVVPFSLRGRPRTLEMLAGAERQL